MTFDAAFSYSTLNTSLPGNYYAVVSGTFSGAGPCEERDGGFWFYQGCNNINPIPAYPWQWNGTNPNTQSQVPTVYNPNHIYNFYFNGGSSQAFSFQEQNASWYGDNSGSLTFQIFYLGDVLWSNGVQLLLLVHVSPIANNNIYSKCRLWKWVFSYRQCCCDLFQILVMLKI